LEGEYIGEGGRDVVEVRVIDPNALATMKTQPNTK